MSESDLPDHVARLAAALLRAPGNGAAHAGVRVEGETGAIDIYDADVNFARMLAWNRLPIHSVLFRRELLTDCRFDASMDAYEDWDFWLQVCCVTRLVRVPGVSAVYRAALGTSGLTAAEATRDCLSLRDGVRARWLASCPPREFEWLMAELRCEILRRDETVADLRYTDGELRRLLLEERGAAQKERDALHEVHRSTSWRLTGPLRTATRIARRLVGR